MDNFKNKKIIIVTSILIPFLFFLSYLWGTGIHGDDLNFMLINSSRTTESIFFPNVNGIGQFIFAPILYFIEMLRLTYFSTFSELHNLYKVAYHLFCLYAFFEFAKCFIDQKRAFLFSLLFLLYPTHDSINFWAMISHFVLSGAFILLGFSLLTKGSFKRGALSFLIGAFYGYSSPPFFIAAVAFFAWKRKWKEVFWSCLPCGIYTIFYFIAGSVISTRISSSISFSVLLKSFVVQIGTLFDSQLFLSFWLKLYSSILANSVLSFILAVVFIGLFHYLIQQKYSKQNETRNYNENDLIIFSAIVLLVSIGMFTSTLLYPQISFNLGNRTTIYASMFMAALLMKVSSRPRFYNSILVILIISSFGLSQHWRSHTNNSKKFVDDFKKIDCLKEIPSTETNVEVYVSGLQYSKLGGFDHVDLFSIESYLNTFFQYYFGTKRYLFNLNARRAFSEANLGKRYWFVDADKLKCHEVSFTELKDIQKSQKDFKRHWIQFIKGTSLESFVTRLYPNFKNI